MDKAEMYRRQLGGTNAALNRARQRNRELEQLCCGLYCFASRVVNGLDAREAARFDAEWTQCMEALGLLEPGTAS